MLQSWPRSRLRLVPLSTPCRHHVACRFGLRYADRCEGSRSAPPSRSKAPYLLLAAFEISGGHFGWAGEACIGRHDFAPGQADRRCVYPGPQWAPGRAPLPPGTNWAPDERREQRQLGPTSTPSGPSAPSLIWIKAKYGAIAIASRGARDRKHVKLHCLSHLRRSAWGSVKAA